MAAAPTRAPAIPQNSPLLQPSQTLSGQPLQNAANQIANAQTQGPLTELAKQIAQNNAQGQAAQGKTFGYYLQLAQQAKDSLAAQQTNGTQLNQTLGQIGQNTQDKLGQFGQQAQGGALGRLGSLGLAGTSPADLQAETARQQGIGALNSQAFQSAGANQGANYTGNAASSLGTFALRGQERLGDIGRATQLANVPLANQQAGLIAKKGALAATALGQLRTQERNYQIAQAGLGIKSATQQTTAANDAARNALTAAGITAANSRNAASILAANQRNAATIQGQADRQAITIANKNRATGAGATKPLSPNLNAKALGQLSRAIGVIQQAQQTTNPDGSKKYTEAQIRSLTAAHYGVPDYMIQAGYELLGYGRISPRTAAAMHAAGIRGGTYNSQPIVVSKGQGNIQGAAAGPQTVAPGQFP